ncbi:MAG: hypothetical protein HDR19_09590 [Lachnospiraceae bacterium]|nr:hypothetical protein [Lachnospiraceae bacterium]
MDNLSVVSLNHPKGRIQTGNDGNSMIEMFLKDGVNIGKWNLKEQINRAEEIQHELERTY